MDAGRYMAEHGHEMLVYCSDTEAGLRGIVAIHDTTLGPALGGLRMRAFASEEEATLDALRLAEGMTLKSSAAGIDLGGGKAVLFGDPDRDKSDRLFERMGEFIDQLGGKYITPEDVGTSVEDIETVGRKTKWVTGVSIDRGSSGDPSPFTAFGVFQAMRAGCEHAFGSDDLSGRSVAVQGAGHVGRCLVERLVDAGASVVVSDVRQGVLDEVCETFKVKFVNNAGGIINIFVELEPAGYSPERATEYVTRIYERTKQVIELSEREGICTHRAAVLMARQRIEEAREAAASG